MSAVQAVQTHMESYYPQESKRNFSLATASSYVAVKHQAHFCSQISNKEMEVWNMKVKSHLSLTILSRFSLNSLPIIFK